jgi:putative toxin-antitoxin system antitoxin component (TIGR02293 family)
MAQNNLSNENQHSMSRDPWCTTAGILGLFMSRPGKQAGAPFAAHLARWRVMDSPEEGAGPWIVVFGESRSPAARRSLLPVEDAQLHLFVRGGLPFVCAENVAAFLDVPMGRVYGLLSVSLSTAHRRKRERVLSSTESDRLARIARITAEACRVFGSPDTARRWLNRSHVLLGGRTPLELLDTDSGAEQVAEELTRIEFGELAA